MKKEILKVAFKPLTFANKIIKKDERLIFFYSNLGFRDNVKAFYDYLIAQIAAFVISVLWSFYWNSKMVFTLEEGKERSVWKALIKTFIAYSFTGLFLNSILLFLWVRVFSISEFIAPLINLVVSVPLNFIINKFWAFRQA